MTENGNGAESSMSMMEVAHAEALLTDRFQFVLQMVMNAFGFSGVVITGVFAHEGELGVLSAGVVPDDVPDERVRAFTTKVSETVGDLADEFEIPKGGVPDGT